ncbi:MAG: HAD-IIIA family hydrolase, partial [Verrucomicrobia bacterium]|nr:HAD-IIIA family hydrolase [Verrucomicrobiota bacterium]
MKKTSHNRAVFLDRDGTIIEEKNYLHREQDVTLVKGAATALKKLRRAGFMIFIVTNQAGIGRGYYTEGD